LTNFSCFACKLSIGFSLEKHPRARRKRQSRQTAGLSLKISQERGDKGKNRIIKITEINLSAFRQEAEQEQNRLNLVWKSKCKT